jgi:hypothetical protein
MKPPCSHRLRGRFLDLFDRFAEAAEAGNIIDPAEKGDNNQCYDNLCHKEQYRTAARSVEVRIQRNDAHQAEYEGPDK